MLTDGRQKWFILALTVTLVGFFSVWLPHDAAGLSYIGLEMGEQAKFLPQVRSGEIVPGRWLFYLPPVTIAVLLVLLSAHWQNGPWQSWLARLVALAISLLAFPAIEALGTEPAEWLWRVILIAVVVVLVIVSPRLRRIPARLLLIAVAVTAIAGAVFPAWVFLEVRNAFSDILQQPIGIGLGVWLNAAGHLVIAVIALMAVRRPSLSA